MTAFAVPYRPHCARLIELAAGVVREFDPAVHAQLLIDAVQVDLHRAFGDAEPGSDLLVAQASAHLANQLDLAHRQHLCDLLP